MHWEKFKGENFDHLIGFVCIREFDFICFKKGPFYTILNNILKIINTLDTFRQL